MAGAGFADQTDAPGASQGGTARVVSLGGGILLLLTATCLDLMAFSRTLSTEKVCALVTATPQMA